MTTFPKMEVQMPRRRVTPTVINRLAELPVEIMNMILRYVNRQLRITNKGLVAHYDDRDYMRQFYSGGIYNGGRRVRNPGGVRLLN